MSIYNNIIRYFGSLPKFIEFYSNESSAPANLYCRNSTTDCRRPSILYREVICYSNVNHSN